MQFSEDIPTRIAIFILAVCGFFIARHIRTHKKEEKPLVCPVQFDCETVVHSDYSRFLGIPLEIMGMAYYALVALGYLFLIFVPDSMPPAFISFLILISSLAFLFSLYLIGVQIFILRKGCYWCIASAFICLCIFMLNVISY